MTDAPIDPAHHEAMNLIARNLDDQFNPLRHMTGKRVTGFMLTVFDFENPDSRFNYISNADHLDVRRMLQDVLARLDHRSGQNTEEMAVVPRAELTSIRQKLADCAEYLKPDETPRQRMDRDQKEILGLMELLRLEKLKVEAAQAECERLREALKPFATFARSVRSEQAVTKGGFCENKKKPGGCPLHNLHCGWPDCDRAPAADPEQVSS